MKGHITVGRVYHLIGSTVVCGAATAMSESDNTTLWHLRTRHIGEHGPTELHKRGLKSFKMGLYKFCVIGKQSKVTFKTSQHTTKGLVDYSILMYGD
ncbi:hypothetical protein V2J09_022724 [Rumex salicifolius]